MTPYILIMTMWLTGSAEIHSIEFTSQERCEAAARAWVAAIEPSVYHRAVCAKA